MVPVVIVIGIVGVGVVIVRQWMRMLLCPDGSAGQRVTRVRPAVRGETRHLRAAAAESRRCSKRRSVDRDHCMYCTIYGYGRS
ncbi:hypothetical protein BGW80DRAFT_1338904 [Lactifluus volemus]|nr:hypothetical protein BGW80DRAFT_1338904 [Lactifluus volemus]